MSGRVARFGWLALLVSAIVVATAGSGGVGPTTSGTPPTTAAAAASASTTATAAAATTAATTTTTGPTTATTVTPVSVVELPEGLTIPFPDGGNVTMAGGDASAAFAAVQYSIDRSDEVISFYEEWTASDAREWRMSESTEAGGASRSVVWLADKSGIAVSGCGSNPDAFDFVCVTVDHRE